MTLASSPLRRRLLRAGTALPALLALGACAEPPRRAPPDAPVRLDFLGSAQLRGGLAVDGLRVGGLSGIDYDASLDRWWLVSDDRSEKDPARLFIARIAWTGTVLDVQLERAVVLLGPDGKPHARDTTDPESVRLGPDGLLWVTSEGIRRTRSQPWIRAHDAQGRLVREIALPPGLAFRGRRRGPMDNGVFEGLAFEPDGAGFWVAMEGPLWEDGDAPTTVSGAWSRFTRFDARTGRATAQRVYPIDPIPKSPVFGLPGGTFADNGVSEILALDARTLLVLERSFAIGPGVTVRAFAARVDGATDTLGLPTLDGTRWRPMEKTLVWDSDAIGERIDNLEGIALGPTLPDGAPLCVMCSDDNFNPLQVSQFLAFAMRRVR